MLKSNVKGKITTLSSIKGEDHWSYSLVLSVRLPICTLENL